MNRIKQAKCFVVEKLSPFDMKGVLGVNRRAHLLAEDCVNSDFYGAADHLARCEGKGPVERDGCGG